MEQLDQQQTVQVETAKVIPCQIPDDMRTKCQRFSRIVGYYAPVSQWNEGKQAEWKDRKVFQIK